MTHFFEQWIFVFWGHKVVFDGMTSFQIYINPIWDVTSFQIYINPIWDVGCTYDLLSDIHQSHMGCGCTTSHMGLMYI